MRTLHQTLFIELPRLIINLFESKYLIRFYSLISSPLNNITFFLISVFVSSFLYGFSVSFEKPLIGNIAAIFYTVALSVHCIWCYRLPQKSWLIATIPLLVHFGILLGGINATDPSTIFWGEDSINFHIPLANSAFNEVRTLFTFQAKNYGLTILLTHLIAGSVFKFLGVSVFSTTVTTLLIKIPTTFLIYTLGKQLFTPRIGYLSSIAFVFFPSVIVFNAIFFKEITVQFLLISFFVLLNNFSSVKKWPMILPLYFILFFMAIERSYILPSMLISLTIYAFILIQNYPIQKKISVLLAVGLIIVLFVYFFKSIYPLEIILEKANSIRRDYQNISSVNTKWNYDIPYFLAILKITFTPFFTLNKFDLYFNLTSLIVWSIPINQLMITGSLVGMYRSIKNAKKHYPIIISFVFYLLLLAYFRPYDGRVRDSYIPILLIYSVAFFHSFFEGFSDKIPKNKT